MPGSWRSIAQALGGLVRVFPRPCCWRAGLVGFLRRSTSPARAHLHGRRRQPVLRFCPLRCWASPRPDSARGRYEFPDCPRSAAVRRAVRRRVHAGAAGAGGATDYPGASRAPVSGGAAFGHGCPRGRRPALGVRCAGRYLRAGVRVRAVAGEAVAAAAAARAAVRLARLCRRYCAACGILEPLVH